MSRIRHVAQRGLQMRTEGTARQKHNLYYVAGEYKAYSVPEVKSCQSVRPCWAVRLLRRLFENP